MFFSQHDCLGSWTVALVGEDHLDLPEPRRRAAVAHRVDLRRLALRITAGPELLEVRRPGDAVASLPEVRSLCLIGDLREHPALFPAFDFPECVTAELEVIALLIDRVAASPFNHDAIVDAADEAFERSFRTARSEPNVRHTLEGDGCPGVRIGASARFFFADQMRLITSGLEVLEDAVFNDGEFGGLDSIIVVAAFEAIRLPIVAGVM
jgi:hypothetical protein